MKPILLVVFFFTFVNAQDHFTGLLIDSISYANSPVQAPLMRGDYLNLPKAASLKMFSPTPGNQGSYGTCAGWATAYSCRTILEAFKNKWNKDAIDSNAFSPSFVYNQIRLNDNCSGGSSLIDALDVLKNQGVLTLKEFEYSCSRKINSNDLQNAVKHRIIEYRMVASKRNKNQTMFVKKSLAENKPVVMAMDVAPSFHHTGELWKPDSAEYKSWSQGHGIGVVGYDDNTFGGAFQLINSWGTQWGKDGYTWMRYKDFDFFCLWAYELIDKTETDSLTPNLSGKIVFRQNTGDTMKAKFNGSYFEMEKSYTSGTLFELFFSNNQPAYVYAFSSDLNNNVYKIFPFNERMVAYLPYSQNNIAIPDEDSYNMLDENPGKTYFCFLYSTESLNIDDLLEKVKSSPGLFFEKVQKSFSEMLIDKQNIKYKYKDAVEFEANSKGRKVIPIIIEINHTN